jgi:hypothetical protein
MGVFRDKGIYGADGSTKHTTLRGIDVDTNEFFTFESGLDVRDPSTGAKIEAKDVVWNLGRMTEKDYRRGGREKWPTDLAYAFIGLANYDTDTLGVQLRPADSDPK